MANIGKTQSGVSLVEICITVVIIAITTLIIAAFSRNTLIMSKDARGNDAAYLAAEEKIKDLKTQPFPAASGNDLDTIDNIICSRSWMIKDTSYVRRAVVTVTFKSLKGIDRKITLAGAIN